MSTEPRLQDLYEQKAADWSCRESATPRGHSLFAAEHAHHHSYKGDA
ncbi:hypothetical protein [Nocardia noduli]|nr:hypothetical protein [Nocardia noduli]